MFKVLFLIFFISTATFASTQKIAAVVGDHIITEYDLDQKIRFTMFNQGLDKNIQPSTMYAYFISSVIDNDLVTSRIKQTGGLISDIELENGLKYMSLARKTTPEKLINTAMETYGIDKKAFLDCVKDDMIMQMMFLSPLANELKISDEEIKQEAINQKLDYNTDNINKIRELLSQKIVGQKAKQIVQSLRQSTFVEIKMR